MEQSTEKKDSQTDLLASSGAEQGETIQWSDDILNEYVVLPAHLLLYAYKHSLKEKWRNDHFGGKMGGPFCGKAIDLLLEMKKSLLAFCAL